MRKYVELLPQIRRRMEKIKLNNTIVVERNYGKAVVAAARLFNTTNFLMKL